ncbi:Aste57867_10672 [Aphanomyces stellatus]|uniref:Aste57867_10672 protein n=1 Tax=Aphanomyces stellatus TaxID=120398 RepID=A0A485KRE9_9STRA|nr:hypothetical protein As57867_010632 [Aphanomyces stellatus]VFT87544.1 Aste57867_10672 [Aphanomyces stellatus]
MSTPSASLGVIYGVAAYSIFGIVPVYYKLLADVPPVQVALHRFTWTFPETMLLVILLGQTKEFLKTALTKANFILYAGSATSMACSTVLMIWAVSHGYLLEVSLGAFLNPITMVVIGVGLLKERLRKWQVVSVALAAIGIGIFAVAYGKFPWVAVLLTTGDGVYSLFKKKQPLNALHGMALESGILFPFCLAGVLYIEGLHEGIFGHLSLQTDLLLVGNGVMTIVPVILLVASTQITPLYVMGLISNISPTIQFLMGVFVYHEPFSMTKLVGFVFLWVSMALFALDSFWAYKESKAVKCIDGSDVTTPRDGHDSLLDMESGFEYVSKTPKTTTLDVTTVVIKQT